MSCKGKVWIKKIVLKNSKKKKKKVGGKEKKSLQRKGMVYLSTN